MRIKSHTLNLDTDSEHILSQSFVQEESEWAKNQPSIPEFYADQEIFVTGGTGFIGKVLIEKLLRSCPDLKKIYILMRPKRGKTIEDRFQKLIDLPLFQPLKAFNSKLFDKLIPISGNVAELNLGLSHSDYLKLSQVSIIFHSAASVRFDDTLKYAMMMNTRGTKEMIELARTMRNLKVFMYVSTTYCHPELKDVGEVIHKPFADWQKSIKICEKIDSDLLDVFTPKYTQFMPNTYTFTKALAEQIICDYQNDLPIVLFRPSIVISSMKEPFPGWIDNFNGPVGLLIGSGLGITRTMFCNPDNIADFTPVDICTKAMIISAWKRALDTKVILPIYNCCTSNYRCATLEQIIDMGRLINTEIPLDVMIWAPGGCLTRSRILNYVKVLFVHLLPAIIIDFFINARGLKPFLAKLQRRIYTANLALQYFILNNWHFHNQNFMALCKSLKDKDMKSFNFLDFLEYDLVLYFRYGVLGGRRYLLKQKDEDIPKALKNLSRMQKLDFIVSSIVYIFVGYLFLFKLLKIQNLICTLF